MKEHKLTDETHTTLTAGEAAKLIGKSVPTITRAIKSGKLSAKPRMPKGWIIEKSELFRVFTPVTNETINIVSTLDQETALKDSLLQANLNAMEQRLGDAQATIEDLRTRLDTEGTERRQLTALLTDQRSSTVSARKSLWARLKG
jgi:hypothetical protein